MDRTAQIRDDAGRLLGRRLARRAEPDLRVVERVVGWREGIEAMAVARLRGGLFSSRRLIVATPQRLLLMRRGAITGREEIRELDWSALDGVLVVPPARLDVLLGDELIELWPVEPPRQLAALADMVRRVSDPATSAARLGSGELLDLTGRKFARLPATQPDPNALALAEVLELEEQVLEMAYVGSPPGLLVATTQRTIFVPTRGMGAGPALSVHHRDIRATRLYRIDDVVLDTRAGELRWEGVLPQERAATLVDLIARRAGA